MKKIDENYFISSCLFLSSVCGLVYAGLWNRYLAYLIGSSAISQLIFLVFLMGGLSLGAIIVSRRVVKVDTALVVYGGLGIGIGLYALILPLLFSLLANFHNLAGAKLGSGSGALFFLEILLIFLLVFAPSLALGGTLPAVSRYLIKPSKSGVLRKIAGLYGLYCLGAAVGILGVSFILIYRYGLDRSMQNTGAFNLLLGLAVVAYARFSDSGQAHPAEKPGDELFQGRRHDDHPDAQSYDTVSRRWAMGITAFSGFAVMAMQFAWSRYFLVVLGVSPLSCTIVDAAFFMGLALGSLLLRFGLLGRFFLPKVLLSLLTVISLSLAAGLFIYARLPFEIGRLLSVIAPYPLAWPYYWVLRFAIVFAFMFLPTVASGMVLPVCAQLAAHGNERDGRGVALLYSVQILGALLGIVVTGQILFRLLSLLHTMQVITFFHCGATFYLVLVMEGRGRRAIIGAIALIAFVTSMFWSSWPPGLLYVSRVDFTQLPPLDYARFLLTRENQVVIDERQGPDALVTVIEAQVDNTPFRTMIINGHAEASFYPVEDDKKFSSLFLLGDLPLLLHSDPANVLVLDQVGGLPSREILKFPEVKHLTTVEQSSEVSEASKIFAADKGRLPEDSRYRVVIVDGKSYLRLSREKYDLVVVEPASILRKGTAGLFSEEFFRIVKARLAPGGITAQRFQIGNIDDRTVNIVLKTFSLVFPRASVFMMSPADILLVGYDEQWRFDPENLERRFYQPRILAGQKIAGNLNPTSLLLREVMSRADFRDYTVALTNPVNTINFPILEQAAEYGLFIKDRVAVLRKYDSRVDPDGGDLLLQGYFQRFPLARSPGQELINSAAAAGHDRLRQSLNFWRLVELWQDTTAPPPAEALAYVDDLQLREIIMHPHYRQAPERLTAIEALNLLGAELLVWGKTASQLWTPEPKRLHELYERYAAQVDKASSGRLARTIGLTLAQGRACGAALPFFRIAETKGQLAPESLSPAEIESIFYCEVKAGELDNARRWWQVIEQRQFEVTEEMRRDKVSLDIKLGGSPPPVYGR
jgi:spermidine synthase